MRYIQSNFLRLLLIALLSYQIQGALTFRKKIDNSIVTVVSFSAFPSSWQLPAFAQTVSLLNPIPLIAIDQQIGNYNPCDVKSMSQLDVSTLVAKGQSWIAFVRSEKLVATCGRQPFHFYYAMMAAATTQLTGAAGFFKPNGSPTTDCVIVPPGSDLGKGIIGGLSLTIPALSVVNSNTHLNTEIMASPGDWEVVSFVPDDNDIVLLQKPFGPFRIIFTILTVYLCLLYCFMIYRGSQVLIFFNFGRDPKTSKTFNLRVMILVPEMIGGISRILFCIDPVGIFYIENFVIARSMLNLAGTMSAFTNIVNMFFCYDVYLLFKSSRSMKKTDTLVSRYPWLEPAIIGLAVLLVIADTTISMFSLYGYTGGKTTLIPAVYQILVNLTVVAFVIKLNCLCNEEITLMKAMVKEKEAAKAGGGSVDYLKRMLRVFERTRMFMVLAMVGTVISILAILSVAAGIIYLSTFAYGANMSAIMVSLVTTMTFQLFTALELPAKEGTKSKGPSGASKGKDPKGSSVKEPTTMSGSEGDGVMLVRAARGNTVSSPPGHASPLKDGADV